MCVPLLPCSADADSRHVAAGAWRADREQSGGTVAVVQWLVYLVPSLRRLAVSTDHVSFLNWGAVHRQAAVRPALSRDSSTPLRPLKLSRAGFRCVVVASILTLLAVESRGGCLFWSLVGSTLLYCWAARGHRTVGLRVFCFVCAVFHVQRQLAPPLAGGAPRLDRACFLA